MFEETKRNTETGGCGDTDFLLPSVCVPKSLQTLKPYSNALMSNISAISTAASTSHSLVGVV